MTLNTVKVKLGARCWTFAVFLFLRTLYCEVQNRFVFQFRGKPICTLTSEQRWINKLLKEQIAPGKSLVMLVLHSGKTPASGLLGTEPLWFERSSDLKF